MRPVNPLCELFTTCMGRPTCWNVDSAPCLPGMNPVHAGPPAPFPAVPGDPITLRSWWSKIPNWRLW